MSRLAILACLSSLLLPFTVRAQFGGLLDRAKQRAEDAALDSAEKAARKTASDEPQQPAPAAERKDPAAKQPSPIAAGGGAASAPAAGAKPGAAPEVYGNRFDFVPGDKVLVFDDFSDTDVGEFPAKWTLKDGGGNPVEVVELGGRRFLKSRFQSGEEHPQPSALQYLRYTVKGDMPKNFTVELDADVAGPTSFVFSSPHGFGGQEVVLNRFGDGGVTTSNVNGRLPVTSGVHHVAIAVSGTQVKVYVAGERVIADPDGVERPITRLGTSFYQVGWAEARDHQMFTNLRIAEGGKPAKQMLAGEGRIVTHGILFDTASDVIKPESGPTLRMIQALLTEDAGLRFTIEGHTDSQGGPKVNGPLSQRRAEAVRAWLVKQGIDGGRLTASGLGQTKPIDTNETAEGRANNRRVEFVKVEPRASN